MVLQEYGNVVEIQYKACLIPTVLDFLAKKSVKRNFDVFSSHWFTWAYLFFDAFTIPRHSYCSITPW